MWLTNLLLSFRSLKRRPVFSGINLLGLTVGMVCCLLIGLYVQNELSYDRFYDNADTVYRIVQWDVDDARGIGWIGDGMMGVLREHPEVTSVARLTPAGGTYKYEDATRGIRKVFEEPDFVYATPEVLSIFGLDLQGSTPEKALAAPRSVVLTASAAQKYFADEDPVGKSIRMDGSRDLTVTAVTPDPPANTHLQFDALISRSTFFTRQGRPADSESTSFWWPQSWTFVQVAPGADVAALQQSIEAETDTRRSEAIAAEFEMQLQPLTDIHLGSPEISGNLSAVGSVTRVWTFGTIAVFILLIAGINFMNLSTARAAERSREVGVRKTVGAQQGQLVRRFLIESMLLSGVSILLALVLASILRPAFTTLLGTDIAYGVFTNPVLLGVAGFVVIVTGLGAGSYPAFFLSRFNPMEVLRGAGSKGSTSGGGRLRKGLVVMQFAISVILIVATTVAFQQVRFMQTADLGFDNEQVVALETSGAYEILRGELERNPNVEAVTAASSRPGISTRLNVLNFQLDGETLDESSDNLRYQPVGFDYFDLFKVDVIAGRGFDAERRSDLGVANAPNEDHFGWWWTDRALIVNRAAAEKMGLTPDEAVGKQLRLYNQENGRTYSDIRGTIVGVVENYHLRSLRSEIPPTAFTPYAFRFGTGDEQRVSYSSDFLFAKVKPGNARDVMASFRSTFQEVNPEAPFQAAFLDESIDQLYQSEVRVGQLIGTFSGLAIFIACLGLFGLATYTAQKRRKEIGIRKSLGATSAHIVRLLSTDFMRLVILAAVLAAPLSYWIMSQWLEEFAYRVSIGVLPLLLAGGAALLIALVTVSTQALRASRVDPAKTLRTE